MDIARLKAVHGEVKALKGGPDSTAAWFSAYALALSDGDPASLAGQLVGGHDALKSALGSWHAPSGSLRWLYAALLVGNGRATAEFVRLRDALKAGEKQANAGKLYAGGSRVALVLALADAGSAHAVRRFFAIRSAIRPPWWRANPAITDQFAASHAAQDDAPETVVRAREAAMAVFAAEKATRGLKREGARLCALYGQEAASVRDRYLALREGVRAYKALRHAGNRHIFIEWAAHGVTPGDLAEIDANMAELGKVTQTGSARLRLAHLVWLGARGEGGLGSVSAMAAVIAAQTAAIIAVTTAATAATTSTSS
ncbi:MAG: hypothetical protein ACQRW7_10845 [Caulobacterales bacterium]|uniref:hypothetical protein n=1 Tax=Glycocaulis sp. TaxID=1969725 RepID=UPI003FA17B89